MPQLEADVTQNSRFVPAHLSQPGRLAVPMPTPGATKVVSEPHVPPRLRLRGQPSGGRTSRYYFPTQLRPPGQISSGRLAVPAPNSSATEVKSGSHVPPRLQRRGQFSGGRTSRYYFPTQLRPSRQSPDSQKPTPSPASASEPVKSSLQLRIFPGLPTSANCPPVDEATRGLSEPHQNPGYVGQSSIALPQLPTADQCSLLRFQNDWPYNQTCSTQIEKALQRIGAVDEIDHQSPGFPKFFDLPAEIRMIIYQHVLGGKLFHIEPEYRQAPNFPGNHIGRDYWYGAFTHRECKLRRQTKPEAYHRYCFGFPCTTNAVSLLYTCKIVHREAALVPYVCNTFSFRDLRDTSATSGPLDARSQLLDFASGLTHAQRQAVKTIQFSSLMKRPGWNQHLWDIFCVRLDDLNGLPGVVKIYLELLVDYFPSTPESHLASCLEQLGNLKLGLKNVVIRCQKANEDGRLEKYRGYKQEIKNVTERDLEKKKGLEAHSAQERKRLGLP